MHLSRISRFFIFWTLLSLVGCSQLTVYVDPTNGNSTGPIYSTISQALQNVGDLTVYLIPNGTHYINSNITTMATTIIMKTQSGYSQLSEIQCSTPTVGFAFTSTNSVELTDFRITGCNRPNGSIEIRNAQNVTLSNLDFSQMLNGSISLWNIQSALLNNISITNCSSTSGNIFITKSSVTIQNSRFVGNQASYEQASVILIHVTAVSSEYGTSYNDTLKIDSCLFENNTAYGVGGAVAVRTHSDAVSYAEFTNSVFRNNKALSDGGTSSGGAIYIDEAKFRIENCTFTDNDASCAGNGLGGGICSFYSLNAPYFVNVIKNSTFTHNSGCRGAGIYYKTSNYKQILQMSETSITNNQASFASGVYFEQVVGTISNSEISNNQQEGYYSLNSTLQLIRVTAANNGNTGISCDGNVTIYEPSVYGNSPDFDNCTSCTFLTVGNYSSMPSVSIDPCQVCSRDTCSVCDGNNTCVCFGQPWDCSASPSVTPNPTASASHAAQTNTPSASLSNNSTKSPSEKSSSGGKSVPIGAIIGGVVGGFVLIVGTILAFIIIKKRRSKQEENVEEDVDMKIPPEEESKTIDEPKPARYDSFNDDNNNNKITIDVNNEPTKYTHPGMYRQDSIYGNSFQKSASTRNLGTQSWKNIKNIKILEQLGEGNFGAVFKGIHNDDIMVITTAGMWASTPVALKKIKDPELGQFFDKEAELLSNCQHPHIVQYLGLYEDGQDKYIVTEFMLKGSLDQVLYNEQETISLSQMISLAQNIAAGMEYLSSKGLVHRDLALRNILVTYGGPTGQQYVAKVADFGLARETSEEYYKADKKSAIPVRWSSPEALQYGKFSVKSDVWSFGVVLWELFSYGKRPYVGINNEDLMGKLESGYRLPAPSGCPEEIIKLMNQCWNWKASDRPSFEEISNQLLGLTNKQ